MTESVENNKLSYVLRSQLAEIQGSDLTIGIQTRVGTQVRLSDPEQVEIHGGPSWCYLKDPSGPLRAAIVSNHELHDFVQRERAKRPGEEHVDADAPDEMMDDSRYRNRRTINDDEMFGFEQKVPAMKHLEPPPASDDYVYSSTGDEYRGDSIVDLYGD